MEYIRKHWKGECSLSRSFWFNFLFLFIVYHYTGQLIPHFLQRHPRALIFTEISHLTVFWLVIYPWQVVGVLRTCGKHSSTHHPVLRVRIVQAIVILSLLASLVYLLESIQSLSVLKDQINNPTEGRPPKKYTLSLVKNGRFIHLEGTLDFGVTNDVSKLLNQHLDVEGIILDSSGGNVYEGRGLFMLMNKYQLDTYSFGNCSSACTIAFIGGARRFLGKGAKLGFHRYRIDSDRIHPFLDVESEQKKDLSLYEAQMIRRDFLNKIFNKPQYDIWFPGKRELLAAGVVDRIVSDVQPKDNFEAEKGENHE